MPNSDDPNTVPVLLLRDLQDEIARLERSLKVAVAMADEEYDQGYADARDDC